MAFLESRSRPRGTHRCARRTRGLRLLRLARDTVHRPGSRGSERFRRRSAGLRGSPRVQRTRFRDTRLTGTRSRRDTLRRSTRRSPASLHTACTGPPASTPVAPASSPVRTCRTAGDRGRLCHKQRRCLRIVRRRYRRPPGRYTAGTPRLRTVSRRSRRSSRTDRTCPPDMLVRLGTRPLPGTRRTLRSPRGSRAHLRSGPLTRRPHTTRRHSRATMPRTPLDPYTALPRRRYRRRRPAGPTRPSPQVHQPRHPRRWRDRRPAPVRRSPQLPNPRRSLRLAGPPRRCPPSRRRGPLLPPRTPQRSTESRGSARRNGLEATANRCVETGVERSSWRALSGVTRSETMCRRVWSSPDRPSTRRVPGADTGPNPDWRLPRFVQNQLRGMLHCGNPTHG